MYDWDGNGWGIGAWVAMAVLMLIFWAGVVTVVVLLVRRAHPGEGPYVARPSHHEAERILSERFARGEIDEQEFTARRTALRRQE
ncbi:SHOCT domain-containing protein [Paeniglutamicibacter antarcticus]|uniref:SHOCT domain-containing protein n=2 Tax=Arthrobacter terrae TaxID=2935737 RepID=A0A931CU91_9MICC|nr:SHOCT domain-containing protein [Arthrobacter terrae]